MVSSSFLPYTDVARATLLHDIPKVPEVRLQPLLSAVLPNVSAGGAFEQLCHNLEQAHIVNGQWRCLSDDPENQQAPEEEVFQFLEIIFQWILSTAGVSQTLVRFTVAGYVTPLSERTNRSRPDAYVHLSQKTFPAASTVSWEDIIMPMEFKKALKEKSSSDDYAKVMWSMHHAMRNDARRRFVFGLTLENTSARLWFNDRCGVVSSEIFDINKDWRSFVHIVFGISRAEWSELGFDPDVSLVKSEENKAQYDITIRSCMNRANSVYRTVGILANVAADSSIGRGTRVWRARKLDELGCPSGPERALKDIWVHDDRPTEHDAIHNIVNAQPAYKKYFLTVEDAGFALADSKNSLPDNTRHTLRRGQDFMLTGQVLRPRASENGDQNTSGTSGPSAQSKSSGKSKKPSKSRQSGRSVVPGTSSTTGQSTGASQHTPLASARGQWDYSKVNFFPRQHYRIVFEEIGTPVHDLRCYKDIITAITGGSEGIHAIHLTRQVHRDISSGNILLVREVKDEGDLGKIIDLEYLKELEKESSPHEVKTGTYESMATEVAETTYIHARPAKMTFRAPPKTWVLPPFRQNQLHDLESVWWVCMWMVLRTVGPFDTPTRQFLDHYHEVFQSHHARNTFLVHHSVFQRLTAHFAKSDITDAMTIWRDRLIESYAAAYAKNEFGNVSADILDEVREVQKEALDVISEATANYPSNLSCLSDPELR
ncbi:kinase domain protein [Ceratobasidium sp. AG-Ba]|nr:kinase domain protein [Ceratobasidium sp. AG-Ba]